MIMEWWCVARKALTLLVVLLTVPRLRAGPERTHTILVFPFENESSNSDLGWISEAFAEVLSARLAGPSRYVLDREERIAAYEQLGLPPEAPLTLASTFKVGETLGVDWAVIGNFKVTGDQLIAGCQLLEVHQLKLTPRLEATGALPDLVEVQTRLAWKLLATHDPSFTAGAEDDFARQFTPIRLDAFENYIRGILAVDDETRLHFLREADRLDPADPRAAFELGRYDFDHKQYAESAPWLRRQTPNDPHYLESLFLLGVDEYFTGEDAKAEQAFAALEKEIPLNEAANNLGLIEARRGQYEQALASFQRAYQGDPLDPDFCFNLAACLWHLKKYAQAVNFLEEGLRQNDADPEAHTLLALVFGELHNLEGERGELQWLVAHQDGADPRQDFSPELRLKKRYDGRAFRLLAVMVSNAMEARLAQETPEQHGETHLDLGKRFLREGQLPQAECELDEAVSLLPENSEAYLVLGEIYEAEGRHEDAATQLKTSLQFDNSAVTHLWLARVYLSMNQSALALEEGGVALSMDPGNADAQRLVEAIRRRAPEGRPRP